VEGFFGETYQVAPDGTLSAQIEVTDHWVGSFLNFEPVPSLMFSFDLTERDMGSTVQMAGTMGSTGPTIPHRNDPLDQRPLIPRRGAEMDTRIEPRRAAWRMLSIGSTIWAPLGERGWRPEIITGLARIAETAPSCIFISRKVAADSAMLRNSTGANRS
jgi:hypothetical protein